VVGAHEEHRTALGIDDPPPALGLLRAEEPRGLEYRLGGRSDRFVGAMLEGLSYRGVRCHGDIDNEVLHARGEVAATDSALARSHGIPG